MAALLAHHMLKYCLFDMDRRKCSNREVFFQTTIPTGGSFVATERAHGAHPPSRCFRDSFKWNIARKALSGQAKVVLLLLPPYQ